MITVYVLKSLRNGKRYVGYTSKSSIVRLKEHNYGCNKWTGEKRPFVILHEEKYLYKIEAIKREKFFKIWPRQKIFK